MRSQISAPTRRFAAAEAPLIIDPAATLASYPDAGLASRLGDAVCLSLARPFTTALAADLPLLAEARRSYAIHGGSARLARLRAPQVRPLLLGCDPAASAWDGLAGSVRPIDVAFVGHAGGERARLLADAADELDRHRVDLHVSRLGEPVIAHGRDRLLARAKLVIVASPGEGRAVDLVELVEAATAGSVALVVDPGDLTPFRAGEDVLVTTPAALSSSIERALADLDRLDRLRLSARALAASVASTIDAAAELADLPRRAAGSRRRRSRPVVGEIRASRLSCTVAVPATPARPVLLPTAETTRDYELLTPDVSVVIPVRDGAAFVWTAIESALASVGVTLEVIVVDDGSTDDTSGIVRRVIRARPDTAVLLVEQAPGGIGSARNAGFAHARAPLVYTLDSDNAVLPHGIATLARCLADDPDAAFAYGLHTAHEDGRTIGLLNTEDWDPELFRLGNYVDASALIRREAWSSVGGYLVEERGLWQDFELWLKFASSGLRGVHAHAIVLRYVVRPDSNSHRFASLRDRQWATFKARFPHLLVGSGDDASENPRAGGSP